MHMGRGYLFSQIICLFFHPLAANIVLALTSLTVTHPSVHPSAHSYVSVVGVFQRLSRLTGSSVILGQFFFFLKLAWEGADCLPVDLRHLYEYLWEVPGRIRIKAAPQFCFKTICSMSTATSDT